MYCYHELSMTCWLSHINTCRLMIHVNNGRKRATRVFRTEKHNLRAEMVDFSSIFAYMFLTSSYLEYMGTNSTIS